MRYGTGEGWELFKNSLKAEGLTQAEFCRISGIKKSAVGKWGEYGRKVPDYAFNIIGLIARIRELEGGTSCLEKC